MIGEAITVELSPTDVADNNGGGFDVFSSLRDGAGSEEFLSGVSEAVANDASQLDLVAVASGEAELDVVTSSKDDSKEKPTPANPEQCQKFGTAACIGCIFAQNCRDRQAAMTAGNEAQPEEQLSTLEQLLREDEVPGEIVWAQSSTDDFDSGELPVADSPRVVEASADKPDRPTEKITLQEQGGKTSTSEPVEVSGEDMDTEAAEAPFFGLKTTPEIVADDTKDVGESRPESASEISDGGPFIEVTEVSSPPAEMKPRVIDATSDADDDNKQPTLEPLDTPAQTETATVPLVINKDIQTGDENSNPLKSETVYPMANEDKGVASVVENAYDGDETTALPSIEIPSIEHQKEEDFVIAGSKSANSEPSRAAENDEGATPVFKQQHLAARFEAVKADNSATTRPIDNSGTKAPIDTQPSEINIDAAADYDNFVELTDGVDVEQPKYVIPTVANVPPSQEQGGTVNVLAEYETNEASPKEVVNTADIVNKPATHEVMGVTHETDETVELEAMKIAPPVDAIAVSKGKNQIDLTPELNEELAVDKRVYEEQIPLAEQCYHNDVAVECDYGEDNEVWAEEDTVFFVEQQSPAVEPEVSSVEVVTIALPVEATTVREEADDLKLSVGNDIDSVGQLDNSKVASVPEITNDDYELEEQIVTSTSPAVELTPDAELDEPVESELGEQNNSVVDSYGYNSETSTVSDNILIVNNHPPSGLWMDDSRLNPEEEDVATIQSGADDTSLVSRLVGVLVVALCVARGRRARAIVSSR